MGKALDRLIALSGTPVQVDGYTRADGVRVRSYIRTGQFKGKPTAKRFAIAEVDGQTIGHVAWYTDPDRKGEIFDVAVDEKHRRTGVATHLFEMAKKAEPSLRHSTALSDDAKKWISGMKKSR